MINNELYNKANKILNENDLYHYIDFNNLPKLPGLGGAGFGLTYNRNIEELKKYYIKTKLVNENFEPNLTTNFMGIKFPMPILPSPMSGIESNLNGLISEYDFIDTLFKGCKKFQGWEYQG